jgi:hypothetical protein
MKLVCSRCGKPLEDMYFLVKSSVSVIKITKDGRHKPVENTTQPTSETLCYDCFDRYVDCIDQLNKEYNGTYQVNMVEVIDNVQYD